MRDTASVRGHLPDENPGFVGRRTELKRVSAALAEHRLVTVTGVGGVGKTRLALRAAHRAAERYPDGAWWTDLGQLDGERLLVALVSDSVDLADHTPGTATTALRRRLADDRLLLVLDSCEHLAEPCARLVAELLAAAPGLTVLATSRRPLGVAGEETIVLDPLPPAGPDALALLRRAAGEDFPAAGPAGEICVRLEGIPLALELAAAQIRLQGAEAVRDQLGSRLDAPPGARFDLLAHTERVWPSRHQTLRAAIGWSHELSTPLERLLWARLSVFRGPFDLASAAAVCGGGPLDRATLPEAFDGLVRASVVRPPDAAGRHRMLDTIREYGATWLDRTGETGAVADRHATHFRDLARRAETEWHGARQLRWYRTVDAHHTDLRTALDRLLRTDPDAALDLVGSVAFAWSCRGRLREARDGLEQALVLSEARGRVRARALWALGVALVLQGEFGPAQDVSERCAREARHAECADPAGTGAGRDRPGDLTLDAAALAGLLALTTGRPTAAHVVVGHVLDAARGGPADSAARLRCHLVRVFALTGLGRLAEARERALHLRALCEELDEHWIRTALEYQLALTGLLEGDPEAASGHARAMLEGTRRLGAGLGVALGLDVLATALAAAGESERAADVSGTGEAYWRSTGQPRRGLPGLRALHEKYTDTVRASIGEPAYEEIFLRALTGLPQDGLDRALRGPD
ncbi:MULTISPECIES: ATP-binding protein [unclassified Streptomyces]|uniref:ATP-binding protein n=1 Tax=unclassified Streptomyces TaxID=2593676 RepID=UPI0006C1CB49|nr:regulator [Streptomyces sp. NRRL F-6491]KOX41569.1 regulator [Streptomyces sp. NRRL F-6492]